MLALENQADSKTYEVHFDRSAVQVPQDLTVGSQVTIQATFTGKTYDAQNIAVNAGAAQARMSSDAESVATGDLSGDDQQSSSGNSDDKKARKSKHHKDKHGSSGSDKDNSDD
jgi:hypothetical protein